MGSTTEVHPNFSESPPLRSSMPHEPSHGSRGAPEVPEPLTLGAHYLTRYNTWNKFLRTTRPSLTCMRSSLTEYTSNFFIQAGGSSHLRNSLGQKPLAQNVQPLPWGDSHPKNDFSKIQIASRRIIPWTESTKRFFEIKIGIPTIWHQGTPSFRHKIAEMCYLLS